MKRQLGALLLLGFFSSGLPAQECVVLVPGIAMPWLTMKVIENQLEDDGYAVWNEPIRTTDRNVEKIALQFDRAVGDCRAHGAAPIHFVTHSMGALVARAYFQERNGDGFGRVVMLGPPNQGSALVDRLSRYYWYQWYYGPAGLEMRTGENGIASRLEPIDVEVGVIAALNDTRVTLAETRLAEMADHVVVDINHTGLPYSREVYEHIRSFLRTGHFRWVSEMAAAEN